MTKCKWIRPRLLDYLDRFITNFVFFKRNCHLEISKRHSRGNLLYGDISVRWHHSRCGFYGLNLDGWGREMNVKTDKLGQRQKHLQAENNGFQTERWGCVICFFRSEEHT